MAVYTTINDPSAQFQTTLWTGNGSARAITNSGNSNLQPDLIWAKNRSGSNDPWLMDSTRGVDKRLIPSSNAAEDDPSTAILTAFGSDGFSLGTNSEGNGNGNSYVAWQWKANGGTTSSNTDGTITSTVQANTTAGFSIVSYSGNGVNGATVGHGLGAQPEIIFVKRRNLNASGGGSNWPTRSTILTAQQIIFLDLSDAAGNSTTMFNNTYPNATTFTIGDNEATNAYQTNHSFTGTYIAYCFKSIQGYSKFGSYTGNNNANGPFIYTGFKPAWLLIKNYSSSGNGWTLTDNARSPINEATKYLLANTNDSEATGVKIDLLSNGFKLRATAQNESQSYIYMAFAENPFVTSDGVPTTAR